MISVLKTQTFNSKYFPALGGQENMMQFERNAQCSPLTSFEMSHGLFVQLLYFFVCIVGPLWLRYTDVVVRIP